MSSSDARLLLCSVCGEAPKKYKCPTCQFGYCCLTCFKAHKPSCEKPIETQQAKKSRVQFSSENEHNDIETASRVPDERLKYLAADADLRQSLRDPRLQRILKAVDSAPDRIAALEHYKKAEGGIFLTILDKMLLAIGAAEVDAESGQVSFVGLPDDLDRDLSTAWPVTGNVDVDVDGLAAVGAAGVGAHADVGESEG